MHRCLDLPLTAFQSAMELVPVLGQVLHSCLHSKEMAAQQFWPSPHSHYCLVMLPFKPGPELWSTHKHFAQVPSPGEKGPCSPSHHNACAQGEGPQHGCKRTTLWSFSVCNKNGNRKVVMADNRLKIIYWSYVLLLCIQYGPINKPSEKSWWANGLQVLKPVLALFQTIKLLTDKVPSPLQQNRTNFKICETVLCRDR